MKVAPVQKSMIQILIFVELLLVDLSSEDGCHQEFRLNGSYSGRAQVLHEGTWYDSCYPDIVTANNIAERVCTQLNCAYATPLKIGPSPRLSSFHCLFGNITFSCAHLFITCSQAPKIEEIISWERSLDIYWSSSCPQVKNPHHFDFRVVCKDVESSMVQRTSAPISSNVTTVTDLFPNTNYECNITLFSRNLSIQLSSDLYYTRTLPGTKSKTVIYVGGGASLGFISLIILIVISISVIFKISRRKKSKGGFSKKSKNKRVPTYLTPVLPNTNFITEEKSDFFVEIKENEDAPESSSLVLELPERRYLDDDNFLHEQCPKTNDETPEDLGLSNDNIPELPHRSYLKDKDFTEQLEFDVPKLPERNYLEIDSLPRNAFGKPENQGPNKKSAGIASIQNQIKDSDMLDYHNRVVEPRNSSPGMGQVNRGQKTIPKKVSALDAPTEGKSPPSWETKGGKQATARENKIKVSSDDAYIQVIEHSETTTSLCKVNNPLEGAYMCLSDTMMQSSAEDDYMSLHQASGEKESSVPGSRYAQRAYGQGEYLASSDFTKEKQHSPTAQQVTDDYGGTGNYMSLIKSLEDTISSLASDNKTNKKSYGEALYTSHSDSTRKKPSTTY